MNLSFNYNKIKECNCPCHYPCDLHFHCMNHYDVHDFQTISDISNQKLNSQFFPVNDNNDIPLQKSMDRLNNKFSQNINDKSFNRNLLLKRNQSVNDDFTIILIFIQIFPR